MFRSVLKAPWSGSPSKPPATTSIPDPRAARSVRWWAGRALQSPTEM